MLIIPLVFLIIIQSQLLHTQSLSFENITVSNDFLQNLFINEIRTNSKLPTIDVDDIVNGEKCILQLQELAKFSLETIQFLDSWGKFPASGFMSGHFIDIGNYDQCVQISTVLIPSHGATNGKYCLATFPNLLLPKMDSPEVTMLKTKDTEDSTEEVQIFGNAFQNTLNFQLGICIPEICSSDFLSKILQKSITSFDGLDQRLAESTISNCSVAKKPDFRPIDIIAIVLFSVIGVLMFFSSLYDLWTAHFRDKPVPLLLAFSVITNGRNLFMIKTEKSPNSITCLDGIRALSIFWVLYCHDYLNYLRLNTVNMSYALTWANSLGSMIVFMGTIVVDSYFFIGGLLIAWLGLKELDKTKGKLNITSKYRHRYIRLTPALAAVVLFTMTLNNYIGSGPFRKQNNDCDKSWWKTLLYVQNYASSKKISEFCIHQAWYLACEFQLYVLSPLILIPLWKWGKKFIPAIITLAILSISCVIATYFAEGITNVAGLGNPFGNVPLVYARTHGRYSPWLVGIVLGYIMHNNRNKSIRIPVIVQLFGWIVSLGSMLFIVFGLHFFLEFPYDSTIGIAATAESLKRVFWALALAWIVFACHFGYGGLVNSILSHPFWQPLGRLSYCMYLVHMIVQEIKYGIIRTDVYLSDFNLILELWSTYGPTLLSAIILSLSFEAPAMAIDKALFGEKKTKSDRCDD